MKVNNTYIAVAKDGNNQKFNAYPRTGHGDYLLRFFVDDYAPNGTKHNQWAGKGCTGFETQEEAYKWGLFVASNMEIAGDYKSAKAICDANAAYRKVKETTLDKVFG